MQMMATVVVLLLPTLVVMTVEVARLLLMRLLTRDGNHAADVGWGSCSSG